MEILGFNIPLWVVLVLVIVYASYKYFSWNFGVFKELGIRGPRPYPLFGNSWPLFTKGVIYHDNNLIENYGKVFGFFQGRNPQMMVADIDMLKEILVSRFDCFTNRQQANVDAIETPMNLMLTNLTDDHWKHVRSMLSPTFSTGKLKNMTGLINHAGRVLVTNLGKSAEKDEVVDFRETAGCYTMDVIGSTAFGILVDSQGDPDNEFTKIANKATEVKLSPAALLFFLAPGLLKYTAKVGITLLSREVRDFFIKLTQKTIEARELQGKEDADSKRADLLQLMLNARSDEVTDDIGGVGGDVSHLAVDTTGVWSKEALTKDEIIAQCFLFFLAGFDTTAGMISFLAYNLAVNPDCQDTLREEIDRVMEGHSEPKYDLVKKMTYLDMCLNESLRLFPAAPRVDRECGKDVTISGQFIPNGMVVAIPIYWLHYDPAVWPEPEVFKPERFSPEEKAARDPLHHMPFGYGPRSCIAMRLALFECKMCLVHILQNFKIVKCEETKVPLELEKFRARAVGGIKVKFQKRI